MRGKAIIAIITAALLTFSPLAVYGENRQKSGEAETGAVSECTDMESVDYSGDAIQEAVGLSDRQAADQGIFEEDTDLSAQNLRAGEEAERLEEKDADGDTDFLSAGPDWSSDYLILWDEGPMSDWRVRWSLDFDGTLVIIGDSPLNMKGGNDNVWSDLGPKEHSYLQYKESITQIFIKGNIQNICSEAFAGFSNVQAVYVQTDISAIGADAFKDCSSLTELELPDSLLRIDKGAFSGCSSLTGIKIPGSLRIWGDDLFTGCTNLKRAEIGFQQDREYKGYYFENGAAGLFTDCPNLESISVNAAHPRLKSYGDALLCLDNTAVCYAPKAKYVKFSLPDPVRTITDNCFAKAGNLKEVVLPKGLQKIGVNAFAGSGIQKVTGLVNAAEIGKGAFQGTGLVRVEWPGQIKGVPADAFKGCQSLEEVLLSDGLESIAEGAFDYCPRLQRLRIPGSVREVRKSGDFSKAFTSSIQCEHGSYAEKFARDNYLDYTYISTNYVYRMYNPNSGEHFYTMNSAEVEALKRFGWDYEGIGWASPKNYSWDPIYRLYNPNAGDHHYTRSVAESNALERLGWIYEGVAWQSESVSQVPVYRQYNPNAVAGAHNYTTDAGEARWLVKLGWKDEGIAWYSSEVYR